MNRPGSENEDYGFEIGKAVTISDGTDIITLICAGVTVHLQAAEAAKVLAEEVKRPVLNITPSNR
ncbi:MAG: hypothetical protein R2860_02270 [Desulfobacterales bacterium]